MHKRDYENIAEILFKSLQNEDSELRSDIYKKFTNELNDEYENFDPQQFSDKLKSLDNEYLKVDITLTV